MGNEISACPCCMNDASSAASAIAPYTSPSSSSSSSKAAHPPHNSPASSPSSYPYSPTQPLSTSQRRLVDGVGVFLILQDRSSTACVCKLDYLRGCLLLSCNRKVRSIALREIRALLHSSADLRRVEASAGLVGSEELCVAIQISSNGNCIPIFFQNEDDRRCFVEVIEHEKRRNEEAYF
eukprot:GHVS01049240.1.p1 GENE.GHVS01049240.1~~GHVS01049240.1.p1  ORF type:complete len:180 (-),score=41.60 GHVS01049240.1:314-853(-)